MAGDLFKKAMSKVGSQINSCDKKVLELIADALEDPIQEFSNKVNESLNKVDDFAKSKMNAFEEEVSQQKTLIVSLKNEILDEVKGSFIKVDQEIDKLVKRGRMQIEEAGVNNLKDIMIEISKIEEKAKSILENITNNVETKVTQVKAMLEEVSKNVGSADKLVNSVKDNVLNTVVDHIADNFWKIIKKVFVRMFKKKPKNI